MLFVKGHVLMDAFFVLQMKSIYVINDKDEGIFNLCKLIKTMCTENKERESICLLITMKVRAVSVCELQTKRQVTKSLKFSRTNVGHFRLDKLEIVFFYCPNLWCLKWHDWFYSNTPTRICCEDDKWSIFHNVPSKLWIYCRKFIYKYRISCQTP